jgi:4-hydroxy-2-oxoheptanedioate aldolase
LTVVDGLGLDFVFIDTEHIPLDRRTLAWMCRAYAATGLPPLVRIPAPDPHQASAALDGGAAGILAPYIESARQVQQLVGAVKMRPVKGERVEDLVGGVPPEPALAQYLPQFNAGHVLLVNIESTPALANLDEILSVDPLDGVIIGPHDLSCSLGVPEDYRHPRFVEAVETIIDKTTRAGKSMGIHMFYDAMEQEIMWAQRGANIVLHSGDVLAFARTIRGELAHIRTALGENESTDDATTIV